jgi:hypothetical protein
MSRGMFLPSSLWTLVFKRFLLLILRASIQAPEFLAGVSDSFSYIVLLCNTAARHFAMVSIYLCAHARDLNQPSSIPVYYLISCF